MKLQRTTFILILLALGLGGFVYFYEIRGALQREEAKQKQQQIFNFAADDIQSLTINKNNAIISIERNTSSQPPKWLLKSPITAPGNDATVSYLTDLLVKGVQNRTISTSANQLSEFGLDKPLATIEIKLKNQKNHRLTLGQPDFNRRFLYALVDQNIQNGQVNVSLISTDFENSVNREQSEWQQPVENQTPQSTPLPLPTFNTPTP
jgi:Domain of unknown function (DUF4340)